MRFLFTTFEGGGHVPPALLVARQLQSHGHEVLFVSDEANRAQAVSARLRFEPWATAPNRTALGGADDPLDDWRARWPPAVVRSVCQAVITGPAARYASDTLDLVARFEPDAIVSNELLFGVMAAAEKVGVPLALLTANVWCFPTREDVPPFGPGFPPARNGFEAGRDRTSRRMIGRWYDAGLKDLNAARRGLGLPLLGATLEQLMAAELVLLGASGAFDYGATPPPRPFAYAGPLGQAPDWAKASGDAGGLIDPSLPNVLVSFSTTYQGQEPAVANAIRALDGLPVNGIVTLGPALDPAKLPTAANVRVVERADHDALIPHCRLMICHAGHGTVMRPLMHGVPVICIPTGRDQPENAQRIAWAGAGLRLPRRASVASIRRAVSRVLSDRGFAAKATVLGQAIAEEADGGVRAAERLEALAAQRSLMN
ncbi:glycosyltransferase [Phenylobacterium sp.]|uniref:glycosyltransferase n=1 Tax=Phenylobacterium sp. TaxID=1871053 RepID=UPI002F9235B3